MKMVPHATTMYTTFDGGVSVSELPEPMHGKKKIRKSIEALMDSQTFTYSLKTQFKPYRGHALVKDAALG